MTEQLNFINDWVHAHPWATTAIAVYLILNIVPRPDPESLSGLGKAFWLIVDRLAILTRDKLPGKLKMVLLDSPQPNSSPESDTDPEPVVDGEAPEEGDDEAKDKDGDE